MKTFGFVKKCFFIALTILSSFTSVNSISCISLNNQACIARPENINVSSNKPVFYSFSMKTSKCSGNCNNINDPYAKICVSDVVKDLNVKVYNPMSRTNETKNIKWHETCKCECRLDAIVCNNKQRWNKNKCRCECKELINKGVCDKDFIWNPSNCEYECNKSCDFSEYLDYKNCKCKKRLVNKLVEECNETTDEVKLTENENIYKCNSCILYIVLFSMFFTINVGIGTFFVYYKYLNRNKKIVSRFDYIYETTIHQTYKMGEVKQINIKNQTYYFYNDMIGIKNFDAKLLKIDKKSYKDIGIYNIGYITFKRIDDCEKIYSVNPLYLLIDHASGYIEEKGVNKYLVFDSTDENKELLKKYNDVFNGIRNKIKKISGDECDYEKDYMKIKFNSDDNLPLNKPLKSHLMTITIRSVFEEDGKLYPQLFLDDTLYELNV